MRVKREVRACISKDYLSSIYRYFSRDFEALSSRTVRNESG